jgi:hypothetical protein
MSFDKVRIFIGTSANGEDAEIEMAYEHSIRKNCSREVDITWMRQTNDESSFWYGWNDKNWSTPFSGYRWGIPEASQYHGRSIYTDVDMINYTDMAELFDMDMPSDKWMLARDGKRFGGKEFCVILFDNAKFYGHMPKVANFKQHEFHHQQLMQQFIQHGMVGDLDPAWNSHDGDVEPYHQLHYTAMPTQPWKPRWFTGEAKEHPRPDLVEAFNVAYQEAVDAGYKLEDYQIDRGVKYGIIGK